MSTIGIHPRVVPIARWTLAPAAGAPEKAAPASGATITIYDNTLDAPAGGFTQAPTHPFSRLEFNVYSSNDGAASGVVFNASNDGVNWRQISTQSYTNAGGMTNYDWLVDRYPYVQITFQNGANTLTAFEAALRGIIGDRNPGS
jgi:hypothetical protein